MPNVDFVPPPTAGHLPAVLEPLPMALIGVGVFVLTFLILAMLDKHSTSKERGVKITKADLEAMKDQSDKDVPEWDRLRRVAARAARKAVAK